MTTFIVTTFASLCGIAGWWFILNIHFKEKDDMVLVFLIYPGGAFPVIWFFWLYQVYCLVFFGRWWN